MNTFELCIGHILGLVSVDFLQNLIQNLLGRCHRCRQHRRCALSRMKFRDNIERFLCGISKVLFHSSMNMDIDESWQDKGPLSIDNVGRARG
ncbi:hypothetical protein D3C86_1838600 [compost metagenome]